MISSSKLKEDDDLIADKSAPKDVKKGFDFGGLEDMDDMLMDDIDSDEPEPEKKEDDNVMDIVKKFHSQNQFKKESIATDDLLPTDDQFDKKKFGRSMTTKMNSIKANSKVQSSELDILKEKLKIATLEIEKYQSFVLQIRNAVSWSNVDMSQAKVHMSFLFASPLLRKISEGYENVMLLDYISEIRDIESNLKNVNYEIKYNKNVATQRNFHSVLSERPIVLHFFQDMES